MLVVVGVINLSRFYLWIVLGIVSYISHRLPGPTEIETPVPIEISGLDPVPIYLIY